MLYKAIQCITNDKIFMAKKLVAYRLDEEVIALLKKMAAKESRSAANFLELLIKEAAKKKKPE